MEPGTKVAIISKSGEGVTTHVEPSESPAQDAPAKVEKPSPPPPQTPPPTPEIQPPKAAPKQPSPKPSATEPQLPPKDRERRVSTSFIFLFKALNFSIFFFTFEMVKNAHIDISDTM